MVLCTLKSALSIKRQNSYVEKRDIRVCVNFKYKDSLHDKLVFASLSSNEMCFDDLSKEVFVQQVVGYSSEVPDARDETARTSLNITGGHHEGVETQLKPHAGISFIVGELDVGDQFLKVGKALIHFGSIRTLQLRPY